MHHIIDHHVDNNLYLDSLKSKELKLIGSATTLVAEQLFSKDMFDEDLALFTSAPILLDSVNFLEALHGSRWTD